MSKRSEQSLHRRGRTASPHRRCQGHQAPGMQTKEVMSYPTPKDQPHPSADEDTLDTLHRMTQQHVHTKTRMPMFTQALSRRSQKLEQPRCPSPGERINTPSTHATDHHAALQKNTPPYANHTVNLRNSTLGDKDQTPRLHRLVLSARHSEGRPQPPGQRRPTAKGRRQIQVVPLLQVDCP